MCFLGEASPSAQGVSQSGVRVRVGCCDPSDTALVAIGVVWRPGQENLGVVHGTVSTTLINNFYCVPHVESIDLVLRRAAWRT